MRRTNHDLEDSMVVKVRIRVGDVEVDFEGNEPALYSKVPELAERLAKLNDQVSHAVDGKKGQHAGQGHGKDRQIGTLPAFLKNSDAGTRQWKRLVGCAEWLHRRGTKTLAVRDVVKALSDNHQKRMGNPSDVLSQCISKGYCEKHASGFFVTDEGRAAIGLS